MLILRPSRFMFSTSGMVIFFLISSCQKKRAGRRVDDRQAVSLLWLRDFLSVPVRLRIRAVCSVRVFRSYSVIGSLRVAAVTEEEL